MNVLRIISSFSFASIYTHATSHFKELFCTCFFRETFQQFLCLNHLFRLCKFSLCILACVVVSCQDVETQQNSQVSKEQVEYLDAVERIRNGDLESMYVGTINDSSAQNPVSLIQTVVLTISNVHYEENMKVHFDYVLNINGLEKRYDGVGEVLKSQNTLVLENNIFLSFHRLNDKIILKSIPVSQPAEQQWYLEEQR